MSNPDLFVDGVLNVTLVKGLIRLDLFSLSATNVRDGQAQPEFRQRLILHPQTLVALQQDIQAAITALRDRGLVPMTPTAAGPQVSAPLVSQGFVPAGDAAPSVAQNEADVDPEVSSLVGRAKEAPLPEMPPPAPADDYRARSRNFPSTMRD